MIIQSVASISALECAESEILANLRAGAIREYLDGDSALEILGEIVRMHQRADLTSTAAQVDAEIGIYIQTVLDKLVDDNVHSVAEQIDKEQG